MIFLWGVLTEFLRIFLKNSKFDKDCTLKRRNLKSTYSATYCSNFSLLNRWNLPWHLFYKFSVGRWRSGCTECLGIDHAKSKYSDMKAFKLLPDPSVTSQMCLIGLRSGELHGQDYLEYIFMFLEVLQQNLNLVTWALRHILLEDPISI